MMLKEKAKKLKINIPALWLCLKDDRTPRIAKVFAAITVAYALSPIDLIPYFIPILYYLHDIIILPLLVLLTIKLIPNDIFKEELNNAAELCKAGNRKSGIMQFR